MSDKELNIDEIVRDEPELKKLKLLQELLTRYYRAKIEYEEKGAKIIDVISKVVEEEKIDDWILFDVFTSGMIVILRGIYEELRKELGEDDAKELVLELFNQIVVNTVYTKVSEW